MKNISSLSNSDLLHATKTLAHHERETILLVLHHLREIDKRNLFATLGYSSLFEYAVRELRYSEGAAQRRISSMRLLKTLPEIEAQVATGVLSLSALAKAQSFFKQEKIQDPVSKKEVLSALEGKSIRELERELVLRSSTPFILKRDSLRTVTSSLTELKFLVEESVMKKLEELRNLAAHTHAGANLNDLLDLALTKALESLRPKAPKSLREASKTNAAVATFTVSTKQEVQGTDLLRKTRNADSRLEARDPDSRLEVSDTNSQLETCETNSPPALAVKTGNVTRLSVPAQKISTTRSSRYIPAEIKRQVWLRDGGCCTFVDARSKRSCRSRFGLEFDHIHPHALGGPSTAANLRLRCKAHNLLAASRSLGHKKMSQFVARCKD